MISSTKLFILLILSALCLLSQSTLLSTPASKSTMRIYGPIPSASTGELIKLRSIQVDTPVEIADQLKLEYIRLDLYSLPDADQLTLDKQSANYDKNQLKWDIDVALPEANSGLLVDLQVFWNHLDHTDEHSLGSTYTFTFATKDDGKDYIYEQKMDYIRVTYSDTDHSFDYRMQTYIFQDKPVEEVTTHYRFNTLVYDTTKWDAKHITLHFVGPFQFAINKQSHETPTPSHQSIKTVPMSHTEKFTCLINSIEHEVLLDVHMGIIHIDLATSDDQVIVSHRSAFSFSCPGISVIQTYPHSSSFNYATEAIAVITIYEEEELITQNIIDQRAVNVKLFYYTNVPSRLIGEGWIENKLAMVTYGVEFENDEISPEKTDSLTFEWSKVFFEETVHSYAFPYEISHTRTQWSTHQVSELSSNDRKNPPYTIKYALKDIFNAVGITLSDFIVQQYASIEDKKQAVGAVNVFQYHHTAFPIRASAKSDKTKAYSVRSLFSSEEYQNEHGKPDLEGGLQRPPLELLSYSVVPQLTTYQAIATEARYDPAADGFFYFMNSTLTSFNVIQFSFPRGAQVFIDDYSTCNVVIKHDNLETDYPIAGKITKRDTYGFDLLTFDLRTVHEKPVVAIGDTVTIRCHDGEIDFIEKQPVLSQDYITCQVVLETAELSEVSRSSFDLDVEPISLPIIEEFKGSALHIHAPLLKTKTSGPVFQTTVQFIPYRYTRSMLIVLAITLVFLLILIFSLFSTPILICLGVFSSNDRVILANIANDDQYAMNTTYGTLSSSSSNLTAKDPKPKYTPPALPTQPESSEVLLNSHGKPVKGILKK